MANPWEKYQQAQPSGQQKPWEKYASPQTQQNRTADHSETNNTELPAVDPNPVNSSANKPNTTSSGSEAPAFADLAVNKFNQFQQSPDGQKIMNAVASGGIGQSAAPLGQAIKGLGNFLTSAAERSKILGMVKNPAELGPYVSGKLKDAESAFDENIIGPKMDARTNILQQATDTGNAPTIDPSKFMGISPELDSVVSQLPKGGPVQISPDEYNAISSAANKAAQYKPGLVYDLASDAKVKAGQNAGDLLRDAGYGVDPEVGELGNQLHNAYSLKDAVLKGSGNNPISSVTGQSLDKLSKLGQFDAQAGTDLTGLGQNIKTAQTRLGLSPDLTGVTGVGALAKQAMGLAPRAYDATAAAIKPPIDKLSQFLTTSPIGQKLGAATLQKLLGQQTPTDGNGNGL